MKSQWGDKSKNLGAKTISLKIWRPWPATYVIQTLDYLKPDNPNSSEAMFYYEYHYNLQDGGSLVALWQL